MHIIEFVFLLLAASVILTTLLRHFQLPTLLGYLVIGLCIGPAGFQMVTDSSTINSIAEFGILAMMFTLGLKFSVPKLMSSKAHVFGLGGLQMLSVIVIASPWLHFILGVSWHSTILFASVLAMSSTAVVSKSLLESGEITTPHGVRSISVLLFQDMAVIPLLIYFSYDSAASDATLLPIVLTISAVIFFLVYIMPRVIPPVVDFFAKMGTAEIFTLFALSLVVGLAVLTELAGLSIALGAFVTGMLLSDSRHRYLIEDIISPFREIFIGLFFISIGLLIDPGVFKQQWQLILIISLLLLTLKPLLIFTLTTLLGAHRWTAIYTAVALGGTGEFGFVLLTAAVIGSNAELVQVIFAVNLACMIAPSMLLGVIGKMRTRLAQDEWMLQARDVTAVAKQAKNLKDHVILCGYGQHSRIITRFLNKRAIPWVATELNYEIYASSHKAGLNVVYGDARNSEILIALGVHDAKAMVITYTVQSSTVQAVQAARNIAPDLPITVKVHGQGQIQEVRDAGASYLSIADIESGATMAARVLQEYGISNQIISHDIHDLHEEMVKHGGSLMHRLAMDSMKNDSTACPFLFLVSDRSQALGKTLEWLKQTLRSSNVEFIDVHRNDKRIELGEDGVFEKNDSIVLSGNQFDLDAVEALLQK